MNKLTFVKILCELMLIIKGETQFKWYILKNVIEMQAPKRIDHVKYETNQCYIACN